MNQVIATAEMAYRQFLTYLKHENTSEVLPEVFNPFINDVQVDWVKIRLPKIEFTQKNIDDLPLKVITDGSIIPTLKSISDNLFQLPVEGYEIQDGDTFPLYLHGLSVRVKVRTSSIWTPVFLLRSDKGNMIEDNPFRNTILYYERIGTQIRIIPPDDSVYTMMRLEYLRYPREYFFDELNPEDNNENTSHTPGEGSVNFEFGPMQRLDIIKMGVRKYLGKEEDPRYNVNINEEIIESIN